MYKHGQATISRHWNWNLRREQKGGGTEGCPRVGEEGQGIQTARPAAGGPKGPHQHAQQACPRSLTLPRPKPNQPTPLLPEQLIQVPQFTIT